jgi:hypothetical protein
VEFGILRLESLKASRPLSLTTNLLDLPRALSRDRLVRLEASLASIGAPG